MDIKNIISSTRHYNLHSHTQYCDGHADMLTMARAAIACGIEHYGFTPHSPIPIESPCNMPFDAVDSFLAEVKRIKSDPAFSACSFYAGMEIDYLGKGWGPANGYFRNLPLDFSIGSVHFIPTQEGDFVDIDGRPERFKERMRTCFRNDIEYVVYTFFEHTRDMIEDGGFDILGHFDKIAHNSSVYKPGILESSFYKECIDPVIGLIIDKGLTIELNTKARKEYGFFFPSENILPRLAAAGISIVVNSDAHYPERIEASRDEAFEILDKINAPA